jgi:hypothetical protein
MCTSETNNHVETHVEDNDTIHSSDPSLEADVSTPLSLGPLRYISSGMVRKLIARLFLERRPRFCTGRQPVEVGSPD